ncbi:LacI family DNA-binding transcriptional regulator [Deinococcus misasensis]|uniref:LacI family DNA-binding transcriptional regulator n=1 Tax=Deinococcus misasensis TaxID=392413 RepID=UPI00068E31AE|nr:LacI family DNA-binding transcriptional regulator [Deinococcus misasensis]
MPQDDLPTRTDPPTVRELARKAGVSIATVSRALNNTSGISPETREHVLNTALEMGYDLSRLRQQPIRRIGFFLERDHHNASSLVANPFYYPVFMGVEEACRKAKLAMSYCSFALDESIQDIIDLHALDAIVCAGYCPEHVLEAFRKSGKPTVLIDHQAEGLFSVMIDNQTWAYRATQHLLALGRRNLAFIKGPDHPSILERLQGFKDALADSGVALREGFVVTRRPPEAEQGAYTAMQHLLTLKDRPDGVFAYNDASALYAIEACLDAGLRIPEDIAVVGFDDIQAAADHNPSLSTVHIDPAQMGREGVQLLLSGAGGPVVRVGGRLVIRQSTRIRPMDRR